MTISTAKRIWSDQELLALPKDGYDREIVNGDLVVSPAGSDHGAIIMSIAGPLYVYVAKKQLGQVLDGQTGCRMSNGDLLSPDISFVSAVAWNEHRKSNTTFYQGGPDLAVEVMSRDDSQKIIELKLAEYFR